MSCFLLAAHSLHRTGLHNFFVRESATPGRLLGQKFEPFWKPNVCAGMEMVPGRVGACLSLLRLLSRPKWLHGLVPIMGPPLSSVLSSLRLGQQDMWGASFIDGSTAEQAVLNMVLGELGAQPVSSISSPFADL